MDIVSTGDSTGLSPASVAPQSTPATTAPVSPAQTTAQTIVDTSALIAQYEQRIRNLMSEKDKAIHERNQAIAQLTELQQNYTSLQEQTQTSLSGAANAAQQAIDRSNQLERQVAELQGQSLRAQALLEKPHLAPYAQFIPAASDPEKVKAAIEQLEQIRNQDLERSRQQQQPFFSQQQQQQPIGMQPQQGGESLANLSSLYGNRPNIPIALMPGSTPAQMSPAGAATNQTAAIESMLKEARASGNPADFERAMQQAILLANNDIRQQLGSNR